MNANDILLWLSARQEGSWASYKAAIEEMDTPAEGADDEPDDRELAIHQRLRLNLERLAHVEFGRADFPNGWRVVPPTIAATSGRTIGILCGARTDESLAQIAQNAREIRITPQSECPDCIELLEADSIGRIAADNGFLVQDDATESLLAAIPPVDDWQLRRPCELPFGNGAPVSRFCPTKLGWESSEPSEARKVSFGLFRWDLPYERHYYLIHRRHAFRLPVQIGKYLVLRQIRRRVLAFDPTTEILRVPVICRPPMLVDRALTLRTGILPTIEQGALVYQNITKEVALTTAAILRQ
jgi:hypothetical protein